MQLLRSITLVFAVAIGLSVLALVTHTFWFASQVDPPRLNQTTQDMQILVIILLGLAGLYTVILLLAPSMSERILREQAEVSVQSVKAELSIALRELRELKDEIRQIMAKQIKATREIRPSHIAAPDPLRPGGSGQLQTAELRATGVATAEMHYALACLLTRQGRHEEAIRELQGAFRSKSHAVEKQLTKDTEPGGPLHTLATTAPYDTFVNELLMNVSVGA